MKNSINQQYFDKVTIKALVRQFPHLDFIFKSEEVLLIKAGYPDKLPWIEFNLETLNITFLCKEEYYEDVIFMGKIGEFIYNLMYKDQSEN